MDKLSGIIFTQRSRKYRVDGTEGIYQYFDYEQNRLQSGFLFSKNIMPHFKNKTYIPIKWLNGHTVCAECNPFHMD